MVGHLVNQYIRTRKLFLCVDEISGEICMVHEDKRTMKRAVMDPDGVDTNMNGPYNYEYAPIKWGKYYVYICVNTVE
jgi:hypothetical protein